MLRYIFLYICAALSFFICGITINIIQILLLVTVKPICKFLYKKINYYLCYMYFCMFVFFVDWYSKSELFLYMNKDDYEKYFGKEHAYLIANHSTEIDWIMLLSLSEKANCLGNSKTFIKNVVQYVPGFGMILYLADYICLTRTYAKDKAIIENKVKEIVEYEDPIWLVLYPEGTRFSIQKHKISLEFARERGLPLLKHHLTPRTKGFITSLPPMKNKMSAIYDTTIAFSHTDKNKPTIRNLFLGNKIILYIHITRIPFNEVPQDEKGAFKFLNDLFIKKDKLRENFYNYGNFFTESDSEQNIVPIRLKRSNKILFTVLMWYIFSINLVMYYLISFYMNGQIIQLYLLLSFILAVAFIVHKAMEMSEIKKTS